MDEKLSDFREWLAEWQDTEWDHATVKALDVVIGEFDERFGA